MTRTRRSPDSCEAARPGHLIDSAEAGQVELASSAALLAELQGALSRGKFARQLAKRGLTVADVFDGYAAMVTLVTPGAIAPTVRAIRG